MTHDAARCRNCDARLHGAFCASCGQKVAALDPTIAELLKDVFQQLVDLDGRIVTSLRLLLTRPGFLTREYFEGRRARYVSPIRLYLLASVVCFAVTSFVRIPGVAISCSSCPVEVRAEREQEMAQALSSSAPRAMFLLLPVFAGFVALGTRGSRKKYPQHVYFAVHVHAVWFFAATVAALGGLVPAPEVGIGIALAAAVYAGLYFHLALRRAYSHHWFGAGTVILILYLVVVVATISVIVVPLATRA
jgi:hypothetical protein